MRIVCASAFLVVCVYVLSIGGPLIVQGCIVSLIASMYSLIVFSPVIVNEEGLAVILAH